MIYSRGSCTAHTIFKVFAGLCACVIGVQPAIGGPAPAVQTGRRAYPGRRARLESYLTVKKPGLRVWAQGKSMIDGKSLLRESTLSIPAYENIERVILVWSGAVPDDPALYTLITLKAPDQKPVSIQADQSYESRLSGGIYSCIADITAHYAGKGSYRVSGLASRPVRDRSGKTGYPVGGYAIIVIYRDARIAAERECLLKAGLLVLPPGDIYPMEIMDLRSGLFLEEMVVVGGHGLKGNASANLLNGISVSGKEDWDGSSGTYWDVDQFSIDRDRVDIKHDGLTLAFDSLLQWIYPVAAVFIFEKGG